MSFHDVTETPQSLYPDGFQESVIITNDGPGTLYVDENSAVSDLSYAIPATGTMVWDRHRPLFVRSLSKSRLIITRNGSLQVNNSAIYRTVYEDIGAGIGSPVSFESDMLEVVSYNTLHVIMTEYTSSTTLASTEYYEVNVTWYDRDGGRLSDVVYRGWRGIGSPPTATVTIPVKGHFCIIFVDDHTATTRPWGLRIVGTSRMLRDSWDSFNGYAAQSIAGFSDLKQSEGFAMYYQWVAPNFIYLNGLGNKLSVSVRIPAVMTADDDVRIQTKDGYIVGRIYIASGTFANTVFSDTFTVPCSEPLYITGTPPSGPANYDVSVQWEDYNGG